jgi:hypothetical protein
MRNGSGEEYDFVFTADGAFIRGVYATALSIAGRDGHPRGGAAV